MDNKQRAERAKHILNEEIFQQAFDAIENNIYTKLKSVGVSDSEGQRDLIVTLQLLHGFKKVFVEHVKTGKLIEMAESKPHTKRI